MGLGTIRICRGHGTVVLHLWIGMGKGQGFVWTIAAIAKVACVDREKL